MNGDLLRQSLDVLSNFYIGDAPIGQTVQKVVELSQTAIEPATMAGITMMVDGRPKTAFFTNQEAPEIDRAQYESAGGGPCVTAFRERKMIRIESTRNPPAWEEFSATAAQHGVLSTLSMPLVAGDKAIGALNLYAEQESGFDEEAERVAHTFAVQAALVLANSQAYADAVTLSQNLAEAMRSRAVIEQAKGILMAQSGVDEEAAFDMLRHASQRENVKIRDIAVRLVKRPSQKI